MSNPVAILRHVAPFDAASDKAMAEIVRVTTTRTLQRGTVLWRGGDAPSAFSVIHSGLVKIVRELPNGREAIVGVFGPRESIGEVAIVRGTTYPAAAVVCSDSATLLQIPRDAFLGWIRGSTELSARMTQSLADRLHAMHSKVEILSAGSVESRMAALLLDLSRRFGDDFDDGSVSIPIALSRQELASLVSTSFETAIRVMSKWQKKGVLETRPDGFVIRDMELLRQAAATVLGART
ncbi:MAG TPA: Crp/Fnr family transcriptional regulator [Polyangiaceae bacterium]|nr:Crp/Fnr family transcriptional regulator [Polyangiaceae bacterium]